MYKRQLPSGEASVEQHIIIPMQGDAFDSIREEYSLMLQNQTAKGSHGLNKAKYVTFGIEADGIKKMCIRDSPYGRDRG